MPEKGEWRVAFCDAKCVAYGKEKQRNQKERKNLGLSSPFVRRMRNHAHMQLVNTEIFKKCPLHQ